MKRIVCSLFVLWIVISLSAQDIIITNDAKKIDAKILEVSKSEIKYKESDNLEGPTFILEVSDISSIVYSNGKVVLYNSNEEKNKAVQISKSEVTEETVNNEQETSKESEQKISNIATINTKDGQTFKGELVAINNSNVTFLQNGEQKTLSAEQLVNVIFANGQVKIYGNKAIMQSVATASKKETVKEDKPTSTAAVSIKGRIYRDNGHYMYNDTYISSKEVERILQRENNTAYKQWRKAKGMLIGGSVCTGIGGGLVLSGLIALAADPMITIGLECTALVPLSIGLGLALGANTKYNKAIDLYNSTYDQAAIQLNWRIAPKEVGVAFVF